MCNCRERGENIIKAASALKVGDFVTVKKQALLFTSSLKQDASTLKNKASAIARRMFNK